MENKILNLLHELRSYALAKDCHVSIFYHEESSALMRFANSSISLNTDEHLIRLEITAQQGRKRASYEMITSLDQLAQMKSAIDTAVDMLAHVQPLEYDPSVPLFTGSFTDESALDPHLAGMSSDERLAYFNTAAAGLEDDDLRLSGIFSSGANTIAQINTSSEHTQLFRTSDAQVSAVLAHQEHKWELQAEASAQSKAHLDPAALNADLRFLLDLFRSKPHQPLPLGMYDIVFGATAIAEMLSLMNWVGFHGGYMKRGFSFLRAEQVGQQVLSEQFTLVDDPSRLDTFPFRRDYYGIPRQRFPIIETGILRAFTWTQDDADEFSQAPTGHTIHHKSLVLSPGGEDVASLEDLLRMPRQPGRDVLYVPFLHYMNIVNPSKGVVTASSRFGALLLKGDGATVVPYNFRLTQSLLDIFGERVAWMSRRTTACNTSSSYGARNPTAIIVPRFLRVDGLEVSHANQSF